METITSELKFTNVEIPSNPGYDHYIVDRYSDFWVEDLSPHLRDTDTQYSECFWYYNNDSIIGQALRHYGEYTEQEVKLMFNFVHKDIVVYDIGANIGYHTVGLASRAKQVIAFEPNKKNAMLLRKNTQFLKNVKVFELACGKQNSIGYIEDFDYTSVGNLGELHMSDKGQETTIVKLDDFVKTENLPVPHLVKIDVEGYEWEVIQGMKDIIENNLPVIFYEHLHGDDLPKVSEYLNQRGYKQYWFPVTNYNPQNYKRNTNNIFGQGGVLNVLAVPFHINLQTNLLEKVEGESYQQCIEKYIKKNAKQD